MCWVNLLTSLEAKDSHEQFFQMSVHLHLQIGKVKIRHFSELLMVFLKNDLPSLVGELDCFYLAECGKLAFMPLLHNAHPRTNNFSIN